MTGRLPASIALVGAGKMGSALLEGWIALGLNPASVTAIDPGLDAPGRARLAALGVRHRETALGAAPVEVVLLAIKPQTLEAAAPSLSGLFGERTLLVSVLAGKRVADLAVRVPGARLIVRAMPNTPAAVRRGITALFAGPEVDSGSRAVAETLLSAVGRVEWLTAEDQIDAVTAVSGSGPAYVFHLVEAMAAAGEAAGLPADLAMRLARATVEGSGELLHRAPETSPAVLRQNVTSPGGTTAAALGHLMDEASGLPPLMRRAVLAARRRAEELSG